MKNKLNLNNVIYWQKEKAKSVSKYGVLVMILLIAVCLLANSICLYYGQFIGNNIAKMFDDKVVGYYVLALISIVGLLLTIFYKPLADKVGRKLFVVFNTIIAGLVLIFLCVSTNIPVFIIASIFVAFFAPRDMLLLYSLEYNNGKKNTTFLYSISRCVSSLLVYGFGELEYLLTKDDLNVSKIIFIIIYAVVAIAAAVLLFVFGRESDVVIDAHQIEEPETKELPFIKGAKYLFGSKQLKSAAVAIAFIGFGSLILLNYNDFVSISLASKYVGLSLDNERYALYLDSYKSIESIKDYALIVATMSPITFALAQLVYGYIADDAGRKMGNTVMGITSIVSFLFVFIGTNLAKTSWNAYIVGLLLGVCIGSFASLIDSIYQIIFESTPTNLRASVSSVETVFFGLGFAFAVGIFLILVEVLGIGYSTILTLWFFIFALVGFVYVVGTNLIETKDVDLTNVILVENEEDK